MPNYTRTRGSRAHSASPRAKNYKKSAAHRRRRRRRRRRRSRTPEQDANNETQPNTLSPQTHSRTESSEIETGNLEQEASGSKRNTSARLAQGSNDCGTDQSKQQLCSYLNLVNLQFPGSEENENLLNPSRRSRRVLFNQILKEKKQVEKQLQNTSQTSSSKSTTKSHVNMPDKSNLKASGSKSIMNPDNDRNSQCSTPKSTTSSIDTLSTSDSNYQSVPSTSQSNGCNGGSANCWTFVGDFQVSKISTRSRASSYQSEMTEDSDSWLRAANEFFARAPTTHKTLVQNSKQNNKSCSNMRNNWDLSVRQQQPSKRAAGRARRGRPAKRISQRRTPITEPAPAIEATSTNVEEIERFLIDEPREEPEPNDESEPEPQEEQVPEDEPMVQEAPASTEELAIEEPPAPEEEPPTEQESTPQDEPETREELAEEEATSQELLTPEEQALSPASRKILIHERYLRKRKTSQKVKPPPPVPNDERADTPSETVPVKRWISQWCVENRPNYAPVDESVPPGHLDRIYLTKQQIWGIIGVQVEDSDEEEPSPQPGTSSSNHPLPAAPVETITSSSSILSVTHVPDKQDSSLETRRAESTFVNLVQVSSEDSSPTRLNFLAYSYMSNMPMDLSATGENRAESPSLSTVPNSPLISPGSTVPNSPQRSRSPSRKSTILHRHSRSSSHESTNSLSPIRRSRSRSIGSISSSSTIELTNLEHNYCKLDSNANDVTSPCNHIPDETVTSPENVTATVTNPPITVDNEPQTSADALVNPRESGIIGRSRSSGSCNERTRNNRILNERSRTSNTLSERSRSSGSFNERSLWLRTYTRPLIRVRTLVELQSESDVRMLSVNNHSIAIRFELGRVIYCYYFAPYLVIVQEDCIGFWQQSGLGSFLESQTKWIAIGSANRSHFDSDTTVRIAPESLLYNTLSGVAYVELWTKEHRLDTRQMPGCDLFVVVYFRRKGIVDLNKRLLQLTKITGYAENVTHVVMKQQNCIVVGYQSLSGTASIAESTWRLQCFFLAEDYQNIIGVKDFTDSPHQILSLHYVEGCDVLMAGGGDVLSVWNSDQLIQTLAMPEQVINIICKSDRGFIFILQKQKNSSVLILMAINAQDFSCKRLQIYKPPKEFIIFKDAYVKDGEVIAFFQTGRVCWNAESGKQIIAIEDPETKYWCSGNWVIYIHEGFIHVKRGWKAVRTTYNDSPQKAPNDLQLKADWAQPGTSKDSKY